jgi:hypothetical protein
MAYVDCHCYDQHQYCTGERSFYQISHGCFNFLTFTIP